MVFRLVAAAALIFAVQPNASARSPRTITKTEVRSASPEVTHRELRDVMWDMFEKQDLRTKNQPRRTLDALFLTTKTFATHVPGLCRADSVYVEFEPVEGGSGPDVPVRAVGLSSTSSFHFIKPPEDDFEEIARPQRAGMEQCASLNGDALFFSAEDEGEATRGYRLWMKLLSALPANSDFVASCRNMAVGDQACRELIQSLKPSLIASVRDCHADDGQSCTAFTVGGYEARVVATGHRITRVNVDQEIVVADYLID